jgi:thiamine biosynthesis lipoprotein
MEGRPDPMPGQQLVDAVFIRDNSVVSSGGYLRHFVANGEIYHHIIHPQTLFPADFYLAVTVLMEDSGFADMYSTAVFLMPPEEALLFAELHGFALHLVLSDGSIMTNSAMDAFLGSKGVNSLQPW